MPANAVYLSLINDFFTIVNARGAAERRFFYNPLRQLRDEEPRSPSLRRAPEDAMPQHATAWAKTDSPSLRILRGALSPKLASHIYRELPVRKLTHPVVNKSRILRFF